MVWTAKAVTTASRRLRPKVRFVDIHILDPLARHLVVGIDSVDRANGCANVAIDATERIDVEHRVVGSPFDAINGAG
jgi:hypothetical protein